MRVIALIARILLGLVFTVFGLNGFLHFIHVPVPANPLAVEYMTVLTTSHYFVLVDLVQLVAGVLLLIGRFVPLALMMLRPVLVNILLYHSLMDPGGILPGVVATILWFVVFWIVRGEFQGVLRLRPATLQV